MVRNLPSDLGEGPVLQPLATSWAPPPLGQQAARPQVLATTYLTDTAKSSDGATNAVLGDAVADVNAQGSAKKTVCGGG
jgi:hypothetical protein